MPSLLTVQTWLGSLPPRDEVPVIADLTAPDALRPVGQVLPGNLSFTITAQEPRTLLRWAIPTDDAGDVKKARRLNMLAGVIDEYLREEIREELGEAYSPYARNISSLTTKGTGISSSTSL